MNFDPVFERQIRSLPASLQSIHWRPKHELSVQSPALRYVPFLLHIVGELLLEVYGSQLACMVVD